MEPLVSVIIPTYNRAHLLPETLYSLLDQTHSNWECIIVDDGSTDDTKKVIEKFLKDDSRFKYFPRSSGKPKGASSCRNIGFENSKGEFIQYLDSDDIISSNKFEKQSSQLKNLSLTLVCCPWKLFCENPFSDGFSTNFSLKEGTYSPCSFLESMGVNNIFFPLHSYLVPREIIKRAGQWNETLTNNDDAEFFCRVILSSSRISYILNCTAYYRKSGLDHLSNYSNIKRVKSVIKSWKIIEGQLREKCTDESMIYSKNAKYWLFQTLKNKFPYTIFKERLFFKEEFKDEPKRLNFYSLAFKVIRNNLGGIKRKIFNLK